MGIIFDNLGDIVHDAVDFNYVVRQENGKYFFDRQGDYSRATVTYDPNTLTTKWVVTNGRVEVSKGQIKGDHHMQAQRWLRRMLLGHVYSLADQKPNQQKNKEAA